MDRPALPLRVLFKPGALAAGMETVLTVELVAESAGDFVGEVVVRSELNVMVLTVSAKVVEGGEGEAGEGEEGGQAVAAAPAAGKPPVLDETRTLQAVLASS